MCTEIGFGIDSNSVIKSGHMDWLICKPKMMDILACTDMTHSLLVSLASSLVNFLFFHFGLYFYDFPEFSSRDERCDVKI